MCLSLSLSFTAKAVESPLRRHFNFVRLVSELGVFSSSCVRLTLYSLYISRHVIRILLLFAITTDAVALCTLCPLFLITPVACCRLESESTLGPLRTD